MSCVTYAHQSIEAIKKRAEAKIAKTKQSKQKITNETMWIKFLFLLLVLTHSMGEQTSKPCLKRRMSADATSYVCVCNASDCDTLNVPEASGKNEFVFITSSRDGDRFNFTLGKFPRRNRVSNPPAPFDVSKTHVKVKDIISGRKFRGWGGTYSGSSSYVMSQLSVRLQRHVYKSLYSSVNGTNFSIVKIPIGGTRNDLMQWTYNEYPQNDTKLSNFTAFNREDRLRICQIKQLQRIAKNPNIEFMGVASQAPAWMYVKTVTAANSNRNHLKREWYQTWADYHLKYLEMMNDQCIRFSLISTGQRPDTARNSLNYTPLAWDPYEMGKWLAIYFGPKLRASQFANITVIAYDDSRQSIPMYVTAMNTGNRNASNFFDAIGIQNNRNRFYLSSVLDLTYSTFPGKQIFNTEISLSEVKLGSWESAEKLTIDIIDNLKHDSLAYIVNNLILDYEGGPSVDGQLKQDAPILVSEDSTEIFKQPIYYVLAHFSKYITPGSVRLDTYTDKYLDVLTLAYLRPDDKIAVIMYNKLEKTVPVVFSDMYQGMLELQLQPKSINTMIY